VLSDVSQRTLVGTYILQYWGWERQGRSPGSRQGDRDRIGDCGEHVQTHCHGRLRPVRLAGMGVATAGRKWQVACAAASRCIKRGVGHLPFNLFI